jgi:beta-lactamase regulating signal transducer with metallopeptidase domain
MMSYLDSATSTVLDALLSSAVHGTILAAITAALLLTVLRRARPAIKSALWTVVLLKFLIPVGPALPVSLSGFIEGAFASEDAVAAAPSTAEAVFGPATEVVAADPGAPALLVLAKLLLVAMLMAGITLITIRRVRAQRRLRGRFGQLDGDAELDRALANAATRVGLARAPAAVVSDEATGPFLIGFRKPLLVVPRWLLAERGLDAALVHELAHVRRGDTWSRGFQLVVRTLFFFWPVVRWASDRLDAEREMACDQWVLARANTDERHYVRVLVSLAKRSRGELCGASAALLPRRHALEERVELLLRPQPARHRVGAVTGVAVAGWAVLSLASSARAGSPLQPVGDQCVIDESLLTQIIATYPESDRDGDGALSRDEICAHQARMKRELVDRAFEELPPDQRVSVVSQIDPRADLDGNGVLDAFELDRVKSQVATALNPQRLGLDPVAFPGQVCEEAPTTCMEQTVDPRASYIQEQE